MRGLNLGSSLHGNYIKTNFPFMDVISIIYDAIQVSLCYLHCMDDSGDVKHEHTDMLIAQ